MAVPVPGRCGFYIEKKTRFCKMIVGKGKVFCGEHGNMEEGTCKRRIPCPLDPKHTVFEERLSSHLKKCNSREKPKPVYYVEDINAGSADEDAPEDQSCLSQRSKAEMESLIGKLKMAVKGLNCKPEESILTHPVLYEELNNPKNGDSAFKHLKQQASIVGHAEALNLLGAGRCFVEFGAGKGKLSHWIHEAVKAFEDCHFLLVERSSTRFKVDGKHQDVDAEFERLQVDIQHLDLSKVPLLSRKGLPVVGVGKHLCGTATDLALRCLFERPEVVEAAEPPCKRRKPSDEAKDSPVADPEPDSAGPNRGIRVGGLAIAVCCHHRCVWRHYVGKDFFLQRGLGPSDFAALQRMSSWATCGIRPANHSSQSADRTNQKADDEEHEPAEETEPDNFNGFLSAEQRERIGRLCKLLIDGGRVDFLQRKGFDARLTCYSSTQVTLENVLLTAVPLPQSP
ncbi:tRNA:m(4)X modification enzyme TRM13 homolog [Diretmus argenteus]